MIKFIFPITNNGIQVIIEAESFSEAQKEYEKIKEDSSKVKATVIKLQKIKTPKKGIYEHLLELKEEGFFVEPRTIGEIKNKLAELAIHKPITSFPPYLNSLIKERSLKRTKQNKDSKEVWVYENGNE